MTVAHARAAVRPKTTDEDLMRLPRDGRKWELVDGEIKEVPTSYTHDQIVIRLGFLMYPYAEGHGGLTASQAGFRMSNGNLRCPDFGFTRFDRFPNGETPDGFAEFAPDLAVEIISPSEERGDMAAQGYGIFRLRRAAGLAPVPGDADDDCLHCAGRGHHLRPRSRVGCRRRASRLPLPRQRVVRRERQTLFAQSALINRSWRGGRR